MTISSWLKQAQNKLQINGIATARLDCLVLLGDELGKDKSWLLAHPEYELQGSVIDKLSTIITQRAFHTPLAYLRGFSEFYGREFIVNDHVLEPRPESETIIELLKTRLSMSDYRFPESYIVDVGTGSGVLAVTVKLELPETTVFGIDIDPYCLEVARQNASKFGADVEFSQGNLLQPLDNQTSMIDNLILLCNLPYVPNDFPINRAATHEPKLALFGGEDGLDMYRTLFDQTKTMVLKPAFIFAESLPTQHKTLASIAKTAGYSLETTDDFIQFFVF